MSTHAISPDDAADIAQIRRFNRLVSQRIGALDQSYLQRGRPLGEARLIFELAPDGADLRLLRTRLGLDSGYLSRLLRSLERQGLVVVDAADDDARQRRARLTAKGAEERAVYDLLSDRLAQSLLASLSARERARLTAAMAEVERMLRVASVELRLVPADSADALGCLDSYFAELARRFDDGFDPSKHQAHAPAPGTPTPGSHIPETLFLVAYSDALPIGCGALLIEDAEVGEIKRVWVAPVARGLGIARKLLHRLEDLARQRGLAMLRLDTNRALAEAQALYRSEGYEPIARYNDNPYAHHWFGKRLEAEA
ncbi:MAG: GNAT family N-acetyltransferase [Ancalomicrobiaceae bacterium]|nr:GNAT family N-acetyltransferase [Ancalomicrobiaceae bacterium]